MEMRSVYDKIISHLKEYTCQLNADTTNYYDHNDTQVFENENLLNHLLHHQNLNVNEDFHVKIGTTVLLQIFEIYKTCTTKIIHDLIKENINMKNDIRLVHNFVSLLFNKTEEIAFKKIPLREETHKNSFEDCINDFKDKVNFFCYLD
jgi:hypothetical protein